MWERFARPGGTLKKLQALLNSDVDALKDINKNKEQFTVFNTVNCNEMKPSGKPSRQRHCKELTWEMIEVKVYKSALLWYSNKFTGQVIVFTNGVNSFDSVHNVQSL